MPENWQTAGFALYVHWPFCQAKCPYCDFNSYAATDWDASRWISAYLAELETHANALPGRVLTSIYFGGGTPSLMSEDIVAGIIGGAAETWTFANDIEITLEANPSSVEAQRFRGYKTAGVNRVSVGLQALDDADLKRLGRLHSVSEGLQALDTAMSVFDRVNLDLIYARQHQTRENWEAELARAIGIGTDHMSLYQLTIEPGTAFFDRFNSGGLGGLPDEDLAADLFFITNDLTVSAGLSPYEVSNHAKAGSESRHNLVYWRGGDYVGVGPGAHGRVTLDGQRFATECEDLPDRWLDAVSVGESCNLTALSPAERANEYLLMALRLSEGMSIERYLSLGGSPEIYNNINDLDENGLVSVSGNRLSATKSGRPVLNRLIAELATSR